MSMKDIREAFINAGNGRLNLTGATLHYTAVNGAGIAVPGEGLSRTHQILRFKGTHLPSGNEFSADSKPLSAKDDLGLGAAKVALDVLAKYENT